MLAAILVPNNQPAPTPTPSGGGSRPGSGATVGDGRWDQEWLYLVEGTWIHVQPVYAYIHNPQIQASCAYPFVSSSLQELGISVKLSEADVIAHILVGTLKKEDGE